ncbi:MAG: hypothetical protein NTY31_02005 [Candidatus Falkowbacteria bacterium]|nr:hypothetical protein [Candidatus Falkowbacteria bacterium]
MSEKIPSAIENKPPAPLFKEGEVFDAKKRLANLRKKYHGEEGLEHLEEFKEKLNFQELGFSSVEVKLFNLIEAKPEASLDDLNSLIESEVKKYALTKKQTEIIFSIFKGYQEKHQAIKEMTNQHLDEKGEVKGKELFKEFFNKEPRDEVKVLIRPMTINFCPKNLDDYVYLIDDAFLEGREAGDDDRALAKKYAGRRLEGSLLKGFNNLVTIENPFFFDKNIDELSAVLNHEEQHAFNSLKVDVHNVEIDKLLDKINNIEKETGAKIPEELKSFLIKNYQTELFIKDEISAYFKEGLSPKYISKVLLEKNTLYDYGFDYNKPAGGQENEFDEKYVQLVKNAIIAFFDLLKHGYSNEEVQNLLFHEPIGTWPRVTARISGRKKSPEDKKKDEEKYISKVIYHK